MAAPGAAGDDGHLFQCLHRAAAAAARHPSRTQQGRLSWSLFSMASLRCAHLLFRKNVLSVKTFRVSQRTLWTLSRRGWGAWFGACGDLPGVRSCTSDSSKPKQHRLAEDLLASKVTHDGQEWQGEQSSEKTQQEREKTYRTLKYSFIAFGAMMTSMGGFLIWSWGQYLEGTTHTQTHQCRNFHILHKSY